MRLSDLDPLFKPLSSLPSVGPKRQALFDRLLTDSKRSARILDLLFLSPHALLDRRWIPSSLTALEPQRLATLLVRVLEHKPPPPYLAIRKSSSLRPYRVRVAHTTGSLELIFFNAKEPWLRTVLPLGDMCWISGTCEKREGRWQMVHPDYIVSSQNRDSIPPLEPVYRLTEGLTAQALRQSLLKALESVKKLPSLPEWLDVKEEHTIPSFVQALCLLHTPSSEEDFKRARQRLAYDEIFAHQIALTLIQRHQIQEKGQAMIAPGHKVHALEAQLPFTLTDAQKKAFQEIRKDLESPHRMLRLLQGDVGSGKTIVAFLAMVHVVEAGYQAALMVPTDILARQHYARSKPLLDKISLSCALLTGRESEAQKNKTLKALAEGQISLVIGTHALFQDRVIFHRLGLAVVDEQHRFGVHQRLALSQKGAAVDVLVMTATPIPRTLILTQSDLVSVSNLREKPQGRQPIVTRSFPLSRLDDVVERLERPLQEGAQIYWLCPLIEDKEELDLGSVQERFTLLQARWGDKVGLIHGALPAQEKDQVMKAFVQGEKKVLVATTVIEVGVDVPQARIMIIEHAERFGLAQLHQLRGRVGRGKAASFCLLLYKTPLNPVSQARIQILCETEDGFEIAAQDLRLRGEGDVLGTRQSGLPLYSFSTLEEQESLILQGRKEARAFLKEDPFLTSARGQALRILLRLFDRQEAMQWLQAG